MVSSERFPSPRVSMAPSLKVESKSKARGILEDGWPDPGLGVARANLDGSAKGDFRPTSSGGKLSRGSRVAGERPASSLLGEKTREPVPIIAARFRARRQDLVREDTPPSDRLSRRIVDGDLSGFGATGILRRGIVKSASVPANLKEVREKTVRKSSEEGILKKSSAFLANLAHSAGRISERRSSENASKRPKSLSNGYRLRASTSTGSSTSGLKGYLSILSSGPRDLEPLRRSPSVQTLPSERKKSTVRVKKSVSFSSDTSFEEKRAPYRRSAVHEVKVYHKGVLQDRPVRSKPIDAKVPPSWEAPFGGRSALLRAARDADDAVLDEIVNRVRKFGLEDMDVNMTDGSGRTAISYMAGNGASAMLELALSLERVDPNIPDNEGNTPLHFAAQAGQTECLNVLLQRCPDIEVDARNASGFTPLMKAALQGRTKCAKLLMFAGANPTLRDHGRGLRAEQWARFCGRHVCAELIERFARHRLLERSTSCRWGSEPELAAKVLQGKVMPIPTAPLAPPSSGFKSKIRKVFRTTSGPDRNFSLVSQLTSAALCASSPALPKSGEVPPVVKSLLRPLSVPQLRVTLVSPQDFLEKTSDKYSSSLAEKIESTAVKPPRSKKKNK